MTHPAIEVKHLVKKFGSIVAVDDISFSVESGKCAGLLGQNGAGKTSTVRILQCVSPLTSGEALVHGISATLAARDIRKIIGVVPQQNDLDSDLTVWENLIIFARFFGISKKEAAKIVSAQLEFMDLTEKKNSRIDELSGGMKRRLLIARALINDPKVLILDEPTTGLDPQMRHLIWQKLRSLKERGLSMVLTTHYMEEAHQICDTVVIMDKGKILREGIPSSLVDELVGSEVIEIRYHIPPHVIKELLGGLSFDIETSGDTLYIYGTQSEEVMKRLIGQSGYTVLRRPATLEDVFLKITGRGFHE